MNKMTFKRILQILDELEIKGISRQEMTSYLENQVSQENLQVSNKALQELLDYLLHYHWLIEGQHGIDLSPSATVFSKAQSHSSLEAIALFECLYRNAIYRHTLEKSWIAYRHQQHDPLSIDAFSTQIVFETILFDESVPFGKENKKMIDQIIEEYKHIKEPLLISSTLCCLYATSIVRKESKKNPYKNKNSAIVAYPNIESILSIIEQHGVPENRHETRNLQSFYKDTLFHEFDHHCPICNIDLPHMLIASHIKPFRDCAHIYEAIDHHNGLLLCRNHDYLFDQGYISFQDDGTILISDSLSQKQQACLQIHKDIRLPIHFMSKQRQLFLQYHRKHIFQQDTLDD